MRLREFVSSSKVNIAKFESQLKNFEKVIGKKGIYLSRYGGANRILENADYPNEKVAIFEINKGRMIGLSAGAEGTDTNGVSIIYVWNEFVGPFGADYQIILPSNIELRYYSDLLIDNIYSPREGEYDVVSKESVQVNEMAVRVSDEKFIEFATTYCANKPAWNIAALSMVQLQEIAQANDVQIPVTIRNNYKTPGKRLWNLSGKLGGSAHVPSPEEQEKLNQLDRDEENAARAAGGEIASDDDDFSDVGDQDLQKELLGLKKVVDTVSRLQNQGKLIVQGKYPKGHGKRAGQFFKIPNIDKLIRPLQTMIDKQIDLGLADEDAMSMEEQVAEMKAYTGGILKGTSQTAHSVIFTGAPGIGKTYTVMKEVMETYGLSEGDDYVVIQGGTTTTKLFERLFVSYDKIVIFDDCDSMWKDAEAVNILKAALQTGGGVRAITRDKAGTVDTAKMSYEDREHALKEIRSFYEDELGWAIRKLQRRFPDVSELIATLNDPSENPYDKEDKDQRNDWQAYKSYFAKEVQRPLETGTIKLPNKIHFEGRIIFISNLTEDELDDAVRSRATVFNLQVTNDQVVEFVGTLLEHFDHDFVDLDQRKEILEYIKELYITGFANSQFSIRQFQVSMDLYAMGGPWKRRVARSLKG